MLLRISKALVFVGALFFLASMGLAVANMFLRPLGHSITGTYELLGFGCAAFVSLALAFSALERVHISVDILVRFFPKGLAHALEGIGRFVTGACAIASSYGLFQLGLRYIEVHEVSETLQVPFYPVVFTVSFGFMVFGIAFMVLALRILR